jgi:uncharacterized membrane protein YgdD (TMEM256/DUF423 family)
MPYFCTTLKKTMDKKIISTAAVFGLLAIVLGAFGAHALKKVLTLQQLASFETGVRYQMYHALFLLVVGTSTLISSKTKKRIVYLVVIGVLLFSGSIYVLATQTITQINFKFIGVCTPIGGLFLILSWFILLFDLNLTKKKKNNIY